MRHVLTLILMAFAVIGCSSERPICGQTLCVTGDVFFKSELADGEYDQVSVDESGLMAFLGDIPPAMDTGEVVSVADIVSDTLSGRHTYEGKIITVSGTVEQHFTTTDTMTLKTGTDNVWFFVNPRDAYEVGKSYEIPLFINNQEPRRDVDFEVIDGTFNVWAYIVRDSEPKNVSFQTLIADAQSQNKRYQGHVINISATIRTVNEWAFYFGGNPVGTLLYISRSGHSDEAKYQANRTYDFTVFVMRISQARFGGGAEVTLGFVR